MNDNNNLDILNKNIDEHNEQNIPLKNQNFSIKNDILFFKEEILTELKIIKQELYSKFNNTVEELKSKMKEISQNHIELNKNIENISQTIDSKIINKNNNEDNKNDFQTIKQEISKELLSSKIKFEDLKSELKKHKEDYANLIKNNILYKGIIGNGCKYTNMHQFIDYLILNINNLNRFKEQKEYEYKTYKNKIEKALTNLNNQEITIIETCKSYYKQSLEKLEEKIFAEIKLYDSKLMEIRVDNYNYLKEIEKKISEFNGEYNKINDLKNEINDIGIKIKDEINELYNKSNDSFNNYQKLFKSIKNEFKKKSDFSKDFKSRIDLTNTYNKKELLEIKNNNDLENDEKKLERAESPLIIPFKNEKIKKEDKNISFEESKSNIITEKNNMNNIIINKMEINNKNYNFEIFKNISFELTGHQNKNYILLNKNNRLFIDKYSEQSHKKVDKKIGDNEYLSMNYENDSYIINDFENSKIQKNKNQISKKLINAKLEKYKFLYEDNNIHNIYNKKYPDLCVKNFNENYNQNNDNFKKIERIMSALPGSKKNIINISSKHRTKDFEEKVFLLTGNKINYKNEENNNDIKNRIKKNEKGNNSQNDKNEFFNNSLNLIQKKENKKIFLSKYPKKDENCSFKIYTNRNNEDKINIIYKEQFFSTLNKSHKFNKSMEYISINDNKEKLFYKNLSNNKIKVKNLSDKKRKIEN